MAGKIKTVYTVSIRIHPCGYSQHVFYDLNKALNKLAALSADNKGKHFNVSMTKSTIIVDEDI